MYPCAEKTDEASRIVLEPATPLPFFHSAVIVERLPLEPSSRRNNISLHIGLALEVPPDGESGFQLVLPEPNLACDGVGGSNPGLGYAFA